MSKSTEDDELASSTRHLPPLPTESHVTLLVNSKALGKAGLKTTVKARKNLAHAVNKTRS
jgi:hypothetical protein